MSPPANRDSLFRSWLEEHQGILVSVTSSFAESAADLADLRQDVLLQLWLSTTSFDLRCKPSTWIYRVCLNTAFAWKRKHRRREQARTDSVDVTELPAPSDTTADRDLLERLYAAIRQLPEFDRALVLLMLDDASYRDIAEITGITENHVGVALTRARKRLAALMKGVVDELE